MASSWSKFEKNEFGENVINCQQNSEYLRLHIIIVVNFIIEFPICMQIKSHLLIQIFITDKIIQTQLRNLLNILQ